MREKDQKGAELTPNSRAWTATTRRARIAGIVQASGAVETVMSRTRPSIPSHPGSIPGTRSERRMRWGVRPKSISLGRPRLTAMRRRVVAGGVGRGSSPSVDLDPEERRKGEQVGGVEQVGDMGLLVVHWPRRLGSSAGNWAWRQCHGRHSEGGKDTLPRNPLAIFEAIANRSPEQTLAIYLGHQDTFIKSAKIHTSSNCHLEPPQKVWASNKMFSFTIICIVAICHF